MYNIYLEWLISYLLYRTTKDSSRVLWTWQWMMYRTVEEWRRRDG